MKMDKLNKNIGKSCIMDFKTGILVMAIGIVMVVMTASSVSAGAYANCIVTDGSNTDADSASGVGSTASCCLATVCGQYDGYAKGKMDDGTLWPGPTSSYWAHVSCTGDWMWLDATSYYNYAVVDYGC